MPKKSNKLTFKINFLKGDQTSLTSSLVNWVSVLGFPIMLVVSGIVFGCAIYKLYLDQELAAVQAEVETAAASIKAKKGLENELTAIMGKYSDVEAWQSEKIAILLPRLSLVVPNEITLNELSIDSGTARFSGTALDKKAVSDLVNNIENIKNVQAEDNETVVFYDTRVEEISTTSLTTSTFNFAVRFSYHIGDGPIGSNTQTTTKK